MAKVVFETTEPRYAVEYYMDTGYGCGEWVRLIRYADLEYAKEAATSGASIDPYRPHRVVDLED